MLEFSTVRDIVCPLVQTLGVHVSPSSLKLGLWIWCF